MIITIQYVGGSDQLCEMKYRQMPHTRSNVLHIQAGWKLREHGSG